MIGIDTNVLVRFLTGDDQKQAAQARAFLERAAESSAPIFVSDIVMCEVVWVLSFSYEVSRSELVTVLRQLIRTRQLTFSSVDLLARAIDRFSAGKGDFSDYLIAEHAKEEECKSVVTFDRALLKEEGFSEP